MNKNIEKMISKIIVNQELCENLIQQRSLDDAYKFCHSVSGGYTKKEFEDFFDEIMDDHNTVPEEMEDESMADVSGGANKNIYAKIMAYSLSALTLVSSVNVEAASDISQSVTASKPQSVNASKDSFWQRHKKLIIGLGVTGLVILLGGSYYWYKKSGEQQSPPEQKKQTPDAGSSKAKSQKNKSQTKKQKKDDEDELAENIKNDPESKAYQLYKGFKNSIYSIPKIGGALAFAGAGFYLLSDIGSIARQIAIIDSANWSINRLIDKFADFRKRARRMISHEELSLNDAFGNLKYLFEEVKGQEKAKEQVKSIVYGILHRKNQAKLSGKKYNRGDVLYFTGPSGVGKSLMATGLAKYKILTSNTEPFQISASEVDKESSRTAIDQLFGLDTFGYGGYDDYGQSGNRIIATPKNLVKYLNNNPDGVVIIDEYDKMWSPNLDEIFRTITDHGVINVKGKTIDCSGITFILTSNESTKSIQGGNQASETAEEIDDGTGSRTKIKHDKSFINRLQPVEFSNLSSEEYIKIIQKEFKEELIGYWADPEVNGIEIVMDDKCLKNMAKNVEAKNKGARHITKLQSDLFRDISIKVFDAEEKEKDFYRGKKIFVEFNPENEQFILRDNAAK